ncbi:MAG: hypothetical protein AB7P00_43010, partial [Sandaracinaceae bacterium]
MDADRPAREHEPPPPTKGDDEIVRALRAGNRRALQIGVASLVASLAVAYFWPQHGHAVRSVIRGEVGLDGEPRYEPSHAIDPTALAMIDFGRVHRELIPRWMIALDTASRAHNRYWDQRADAAFEELAIEISPDENLSELLGSSHRALRRDPLGMARRLDYWLWSYNRYLDQADVPWRLEASLTLGNDERVIFRTYSYEVLTDGENAAGQRLRLIRRADPTNLVEGWMGRTDDPAEGSFVLMRRVLHFSVRHLWPALHPALDDRRPDNERAWVQWVREEVRAQLDPDTFALLSETAVDQQALIEVAAAIEARASCGNRFRILSLPYNGLSAASVAALEAAVARSQLRPECPEVTLDEAARIIGASERLSSTPGLEDAVERLAMVMAGAVSAHELRHGADGDDIACPGCPDGLDGLARAEVSAYLSAMADERYAYLSLFQACTSASDGTIQSQARDAVIDAILPYGCAGPTLYG